MSDERPHTDDCQGCVADRLTEADRAELAALGWKHPPHTYRLPDEMPPRPVRREPKNRRGLVVLAAINLYAVVASYPSRLLPAFAVVAGVVALWLAVSNLRHRRGHPRADHPSCRWCAKQAARIWAEYDELRERRLRREQYAEYRRLRDEEQQYRSDS